jgi:carbonic anhydrase
VLAEAALERLLEGNRRFLEDPSDSRAKRWQSGLHKDQRPFAVILGCADSRAPAELVFDQGLGDLFVVRVAGNVVAPSLVGSVEFAVAQFDVRLVVVMGHTRCGAVAATLEAIRNPGEASKNIEDITRRIQPQIARVLAEARDDGPATLRAAERANVLGSVKQLRRGSPYLKELAEAGKIRIVGTLFELETGKVLTL